MISKFKISVLAVAMAVMVGSSLRAEEPQGKMVVLKITGDKNDSYSSKVAMALSKLSSGAEHAWVFGASSLTILPLNCYMFANLLHMT